MEKLLRLNTYAMFGLLFIAPIVLPFLIRRATFLPEHVIALAITLVSILQTMLYCGWIYAACVKLCTLLPEGIYLTVDRVKILLLLPSVCLLWSTLAQLLGLVVFREGLFWFNLAITIFSYCGLLYCMFYMARLLKTVEYERPMSAGECVGDFLRILFFPFGIWSIQPRLNDIAAQAPDDMDIFKQDPVY